VRAPSRTLTCSLLLLLAAPPAFADPTTYVIDAEESEVVVLVYKAGIAARFAHDHVIAAKELAGEITWDPERPEATKVSVTVQAGSLVADDPQVVKKHKVASDLGEDDRKAVEENLKGEDQLHVAKYPTITFTADSLRKVKDAIYLAGTLTLHGVAKKVSLLVTIEEQDGRLRGRGKLSVKQSDFGYEPFSAFLGAVKVKDQAVIMLDLVAVPAKKETAQR